MYKFVAYFAEYSALVYVDVACKPVELKLCFAADLLFGHSVHVLLSNLHSLPLRLRR